MYTGSPWRPVTTQTVSVTTSSVASATAVGTGVHVVRLVTDTACHVAFGTAPVATTSDMYLPADEPEYFVISPGEKVAGIIGTGSAILYVTEMSR